MDGGPRIAIDAMGGDAGPAAMIAGASRALRKDPSLRFIFYGDEAPVGAELEQHSQPALGAVSIVHSPEVDRGEREAEPGDPPRRARPRWAWRSTR